MAFAPARSLRTLIVCAAVGWLLAATPGAERHDPPGLEVSNAVHYDLSQRLGDVLPLPPGGGPARKHPIGELPDVPGTTGNPDPVVQTSADVLAPGPTAGFEGIGVGNYAVDAAPPDTNGAVGLSHYVQWVNEAFAVFDKATHARVYGPAAGNTLWQGFGGPCQQFNDGDPIVLYDHLANRWIFSQFALSQGTPYLQCIAVSQTSNPMGAYYRYSFSYQYLNDYPKFGVWPDAYYATHNMFQQTMFGWSFKGAKACAYDRSRMLAGLSATQQCFTTTTSYGGLLPSDLDGATLPPAGAPNYILNFGSNSLNLWKFHVDWTTPGNSTFTGPTGIPVASFSMACGGGACIPQLGTKQQLDSLADRLMYRLAYRNFGDHESLVVNHSVAAGSIVGVRWYELRSPGGVPLVYQQGTFAPDSTYRWMGSIAMDQSGDIGVGYSVSSATIHPGIRYTGRVPGDPLGTLESETSALVGGGSQTASLNRWGDYSSMSIDPVDDCTFWYTTEFLQNDGTFNWRTWITSFKFPSCGSGSVTPPDAPKGLTATPGTAQIGLSWTASSGAATYNVLRSTTSGSGYSVIASNVTATSYTDLGLAAGIYYYVVQAVNSGGTSPNSTEASACAAPVAPAGLSATPGNGQVSLTWSASPGATGYAVSRSTTSGSGYSVVAPNVGTTSYTDTTAVNGTTYYYVVTAHACADSSNSNEASATPGAVTVPPAPTGLTASAGPGAKKITLSWTASSGATSYKVYRSSNGAPGTYGNIATGVTATSYANTGLLSNTTYYYVVTAVNSAGESGFSNAASATTR
jgi:fibronectin type 3 domain-containing protein